MISTFHVQPLLYYCILLNHICQTHRTGLAVTLSITQSATPLFLALTAHVPLLLPLICQLTLQILTTWNCILFGVLPSLAGHTSTVFLVCFQLWLVTPRQFFRCASSFGWSNLDGFLGVLPALAGHTSTVFLVCFQLPAVVSIDCCDLVV